MNVPQQLAELQQAMLAAISTDERQGVIERLLPSARQSAEERLNVYANAYFARLIDCLNELFPVLATTLGENTFAAFARGYVERHPPANYSLNQLGDRFADFLHETRPNVPSPNWPDFLIELARLEQAIDEVFDGPGIESLPPLDVVALSKLSPRELLELRLVPAPCLRLFAFQFPVNDFYTRVRRGEKPPRPQAKPSFLAITRREYVVRRVPLEPAEYEVLAALAQGQTLAESLAATAELPPDQVHRWFADWGRLGLFLRRDDVLPENCVKSDAAAGHASGGV